MRKRRKTTHRGGAKLALILLGVFSCAGGVAFAFASGGRSPSTPADDSVTTAGRVGRWLNMRVSPHTRVVDRGAAARYTIRIGHRDLRRVKLSVLSGLPRGATASFSPRSTRKKRATLKIATNGARSGGRRLWLLARSGNRRAIAAVKLVIRSPRPPNPRSPLPPGPTSPQPPGPSSPEPMNFTIAGDLPSPLQPGLTVPLDLALTNPGSAEITISALSVSVDSVSAPRANSTYPCALDDFIVSQFSGEYGFTVPASSTSTLGELGFPAEQWPQVTMPNRPVNQNGCKGASLRFAFTGSGGGS